MAAPRQLNACEPGLSQFFSAEEIEGDYFDAFEDGYLFAYIECRVKAGVESLGFPEHLQNRVKRLLHMYDADATFEPMQTREGYVIARIYELPTVDFTEDKCKGG